MTYAKSKILCKSLFILLVVVMALCLLPQAMSDLGTFRQNSCIQIRVLSNCSSVNIIEVTNLNKTYTLNKAMTNLGGQTFNYTFCNTTDLGIYTYSWNPNCIDCAVNNCGNSLLVTPTGYTIDTGKSIILFFIIGILIFISILLFVFGIRAELPIIKIFCLGFSVLLIIFSIGFIMSIANITIGEFSDLTGIFNNLYIMFIILLTVGSIGIILWLIYVAFNSFYKYRGFK